MASQIERLLVLQDRDRRIARLTRETRDLPKRKGEIEERLSGLRTEVAEAKELVKRRLAAVKDLEIEVDTLKEKIGKLRNQQFEVKNNEDYRALENEIKAIEKKISSVEDRELGAMEEVESARNQLAEKEQELRKSEERIQRETATLDERLGHIQAEVNEQSADREAQAREIDPDWLSRYERILNHTGDYALVPVENGACGGCHMKIPPQVGVDARNPETLTFCTYCGRLLYNHR